MLKFLLSLRIICFCNRYMFFIVELFNIFVFFNYLIASYFYLNELFNSYVLALVSHRRKPNFSEVKFS